MDDGCEYKNEGLSIVVVGASGDLAKKKTYPSLYFLYRKGFVPKRSLIVGYARSKRSDEEHREGLKEALKEHGDEKELDDFLQMNIYTPGGYGDTEAMSNTISKIEKHEADQDLEKANRLFYFAVPPNVFIDTATAIKEVGMTTKGWNRVIIEKPFGKDIESFEKMSSDISKILDEEAIFRIDHFLGKEMSQNMAILRFANSTFEPLWNNKYIDSVMITMKETFGAEGRGGYFDEYGIIRDVMQNHLLQLLCLLTMEPPSKLVGDAAEVAEYVRDEKTKLLRAMRPIRGDEVVLGQYTGNGDKLGYREDETVADDSNTPTYAAVVLRICTPRWDGVPFIMRAGKALNEGKNEMRVQFKRPPAASFMFAQDIPDNELVLRFGPTEAIYMKTNIKKPGITTDLVTSELDLTYKHRFKDDYTSLPDAYTRLILDTLRGDKSSFVRDDELREAWKVFTPLLKEIDNGQHDIIQYKYGSRGPEKADELIQSAGFRYTGTYKWDDHGYEK